MEGAETMKLWLVNMTSQSQSCRLRWCIIWVRKVRWENIPFATSSSKEKQLPSDPGSASSLFSLTSNRTSCIPLWKRCHNLQMMTANTFLSYQYHLCKDRQSPSAMSDLHCGCCPRRLAGTSKCCEILTSAQAALEAQLHRCSYNPCQTPASQR